ncbi:fimbrial protein [Providencia sp. Je.9.19]|uniref:fimbrial protein n=1 Tax=Providencia sp. Je.9.19 TaxID=3142844 RepID=UPI003DAA1A4E
MKIPLIAKIILLISTFMVSTTGLTYSIIDDTSGHVPPRWRGSNIKATLGTVLSGTYNFGDIIIDIKNKPIELLYVTHFHMSYAKPRFNCNKGQYYRAAITADSIGVVLGEKDGYAILQSNIPGIGYRLDIGGAISGTYIDPVVSRYSKVSATGANDIEMYCQSTAQFAMAIKVTLVRTNELLNDNASKVFIPVNVTPLYPRTVQLFDSSGNLVLSGTWTIPLKNASNASINYIKESCRYQFSNSEQILNLGKVSSQQFTGPGSTAYGENGQQKIDILVNCSGTNSIRHIRASIFEGISGNEADQALRRQGVLLNNLTGPNAAKGIGVQLLINNDIKPLGSDTQDYVNDGTQWDVIAGNQALTGVYNFALSGRYFQIDPKIHEGKLQTTAGFTLIYR